MSLRNIYNIYFALNSLIVNGSGFSHTYLCLIFIVIHIHHVSFHLMKEIVDDIIQAILPGTSVLCIRIVWYMVEAWELRILFDAWLCLFCTNNMNKIHWTGKQSSHYNSWNRYIHLHILRNKKQYTIRISLWLWRPLKRNVSCTLFCNAILLTWGIVYKYLIRSLQLFFFLLVFIEYTSINTYLYLHV